MGEIDLFGEAEIHLINYERKAQALSVSELAREERWAGPRLGAHAGSGTALPVARTGKGVPLQTSRVPIPGYRVLPVEASIVRRVRTTLTDPIYGYPVRVDEAGPSGYGPCRSCLNTFTPGERRILFLYNPFSPAQEADFAGPIFIHERGCLPYARRGQFPEPLKNLPLAFFGYSGDGRRTAREFPGDLGVERLLGCLFDRPDVATIHVRNAEAKCFIAHIERA